MSRLEYAYGYKVDETTGTEVTIEVRVQARDEQEIRWEVLDDIAEDAVESGLVQAIAIDEED